MLRLMILLCALSPALLNDLPALQCTVSDGGSCVAVDEHEVESTCVPSTHSTAGCYYKNVPDTDYPEVDFFRSCDPENCPEAKDNHAEVIDVTLSVKPINNEYFLLIIKWKYKFHTPSGFRIHIKPVPKNNHLSSFCYCNSQTNATTAKFKMKYAYNSYYTSCYADDSYSLTKNLDINVWPVQSLYDDLHAAEGHIHWPNNCYNITPIRYDICGPRAGTIEASSVSVQTYPDTNTSNLTYSANLTWPHPYNAPPPYQPQYYFVQVNDDASFNVTNSNTIMLDGFSRNGNYSLKIFGYQGCVRNPECYAEEIEGPRRHYCGFFSGEKNVSLPLEVTFSSYLPTTATYLPTTANSSTTSHLSTIPTTTSLSTTSHLSTVLTTANLSTSHLSASPSLPVTAMQDMSDDFFPHGKLVTCGVVAMILLVSVLIAIGIVIAMNKCKKRVPIPGYDSLLPSPLPAPHPCLFPPSLPPSPPPPLSPVPHQPSCTITTSLVPWHRVIVIMSNRLPEIDYQVVYAFIKTGLEERSVEVEIYDPGVAGCCVSLWLDKVLPNCSKIICICNKQFEEEWEGQYTEGSPVHALGILVRSYINKGKYPTELFMVTVLREEDKKHIPYYIASAVPYKVEQIDDIYRAITGQSKYCFT